MGEFTIRIAGFSAGVRCGFSSTREYFKKYLTEDAPVFSLEVFPEDRIREQQLLNAEADQSGLRRRVFPEPFLERTVIMRKIAEYLLNQGILLLHGSTVAVDGKAYLFTAGCGVGKSTHTRLWRQVFGDRALMVNDDKTFLEFRPEGVLAYGSPWSGKHGLDTNICVPLAGICMLERGKENRIRRAAPDDVLPLLLDQAYLPADAQRNTRDALTEKLASAVPLWHLACTPTPAAAQLAHEVMSAAACAQL